jgi:hypothetical protein
MDCKGQLVSEKQDSDNRRVVGFLGVGLDNQDGHKRLTRSEHFLLVGGSAETHGRMQDTAVKFTEALRRRGKALEETSAEEVIELFHESLD